ncbi:amidohydrolase family protein [Pseudomonas oryzihabitans]|uniref:amidohydrolase family protein n=1 Tax=Pseudomonas oryzihabitans TaxID=47885 RepID=UPI0028965123|nr:amidohydrolase family protein [Pseudomonas oryzihabitans]
MTFNRRRFLQASAQASAALCLFNTLGAQAATPFSSIQTPPRLKPPAGSVDCHMHLYDDRYPAAPGAKLLPPNASLDDYHQLQALLGLQRMVIVTPSTYGTDNGCLLDGLARSGGQARGVAVIDRSITEAELQDLHKAGVRGIRFNLSYGGADLADLEPLAARVDELGWNVQVVAPGNQLVELESRLQRLPARLVIDHLGHVPQPEGVQSPAFAVLGRLLDGGRTWVKLSGPYIRSRNGPPDYADVGAVARELVRRHPERLLWGSDWPHPTVAAGNKPDDGHIFDLLAEWAPDERGRTAILRDNPVSLYGF